MSEPLFELVAPAKINPGVISYVAIYKNGYPADDISNISWEIPENIIILEDYNFPSAERIIDDLSIKIKYKKIGPEGNGIKFILKYSFEEEFSHYITKDDNDKLKYVINYPGFMNLEDFLAYIYKFPEIYNYFEFEISDLGRKLKLEDFKDDGNLIIFNLVNGHLVENFKFTCAFLKPGKYEIKVNFDYEGKKYFLTTTVLCVEHIFDFSFVPDSEFIWNYLPDFYRYLKNKTRIEAYWNALIQKAGDFLLQVAQVSYEKYLDSFPKKKLSRHNIYKKENPQKIDLKLIYPENIQNVLVHKEGFPEFTDRLYAPNFQPKGYENGKYFFYGYIDNKILKFYSVPEIKDFYILKNNEYIKTCKLIASIPGYVIKEKFKQESNTIRTLYPINFNTSGLEVMIYYDGAQKFVSRNFDVIEDNLINITLTKASFICHSKIASIGDLTLSTDKDYISVIFRKDFLCDVGPVTINGSWIHLNNYTAEQLKIKYGDIAEVENNGVTEFRKIIYASGNLIEVDSDFSLISGNLKVYNHKIRKIGKSIIYPIYPDLILPKYSEISENLKNYEIYTKYDQDNSIQNNVNFIFSKQINEIPCRVDFIDRYDEVIVGPTVQILTENISLDPGDKLKINDQFYEVLYSYKNLAILDKLPEINFENNSENEFSAELIRKNIQISSDITSIPRLQNKTENPDLVLEEFLDYKISDGKIIFEKFIDQDTFYAPITVIDNTNKFYKNFGILIGVKPEFFDDPDSYIKNTKAIYFVLFKGQTVKNYKLLGSVFSNLPFSTVDGTIKTVTTGYQGDKLFHIINIQDKETNELVSYYVPIEHDLAPNIKEGAKISKFDLIVNSTKILEYSDPDYIISAKILVENIENINFAKFIPQFIKNFTVPYTKITFAILRTIVEKSKNYAIFDTDINLGITIYDDV
jgi:hypothetical protein